MRRSLERTLQRRHNAINLISSDDTSRTSNLEYLRICARFAFWHQRYQTVLVRKDLDIILAAAQRVSCSAAVSAIGENTMKYKTKSIIC